jgi:hypothetical protein
VERCNYTIVDKFLVVLYSSGLIKTLGAEIGKAVIAIQNHMSIQALDGKSLFQMELKALLKMINAPTLSFLIVAYNSSANKLSSRAIPCYVVGFQRN